MSEEIKSHLFAIRTTGGQEKVVMRLLEAKANANQINIQSVLLVDNLKGYVVIEAINPSDAYMAVEGVRHIRGQLRGELEFKDIEGYLVKKSTVSTLEVDNMSEEIKSHLFAIRTTGGQEKVVMRLLEAKANANQINIQSVLLVDNLKGYVVIEAINPSDAYMAVEGVRHIRGQLRGELEFKDIEGYLVKKSTVSTLAVDNVIEITGGPFKGMKATITRIDADKEEATVVLLDASYQLPVTVDANYLKLSSGA